ncbi:MAG: substrate-binding domain-containing protein [Actinomycetales bacterium]
MADRIDAAEGRRATAALVENSDCTAIVGFNDLVTFGCSKELRQRNIHCLEQRSVVGYSDAPTADLVVPPLTTVAVDHYEMGAEAARLLLEMLADPTRQASIQFPVQLVVRESTARPLPTVIGRCRPRIAGVQTACLFRMIQAWLTGSLRCVGGRDERPRRIARSCWGR